LQLKSASNTNFEPLGYTQFAAEFGAYGTFRLPEGIVVRHHTEEWIRVLTQDFTPLEYERFVVTTMNGNASVAFQYLGRLSGSDKTQG
jgi:hypothetical protein